MYAYVDAYVDRVEDEEHASFVAAVEASRAAIIFAEYQATRQYHSWRRRMKAQDRARQSSEPIGKSGKALEAEIMGFAARFPEYVVFGGSE